MNTKKLLAGLILTSSAFFTVGAFAAPIPAWDWVTDGGFVVGGGTCNTGAEATCTLTYDNAAGVTPSGIAGTASIMKWGTGTTSGAGNGQQSGLQGVFGASGAGPYNAALLGSGPVPIPAFQQIITGGGWTNTGAAVHYNNVITSAGGYMNSSSLTTSFQLLTPAPGAVDEITIDILFDETLNQAPCAAPNPHGTVCDDLFTITPLPGSIIFAIAGVTYKLSFQYLAGDGAAIVDGNIIFTQELAPGTAVLFTQARIDVIPVPVPGALALMGMGLLMLGWRVRGRKVA